VVSDEPSTRPPVPEGSGEHECAVPRRGAADAFASVLGTGRGNGRPREPDEPRELSPVDRARSFVEWTKDAIYVGEDAYLEAEREAAEKLGLKVMAGTWRGVRREANYDARAFTLTAVYHDDTLIGFIGPGIRGLLIYDDARASGVKR
jgi:hypothetical protein